MATRGRSFGTLERVVQKAVTAFHRSAYDLSGGRVGQGHRRHPVAILTTTGRKTGRDITVVRLPRVHQD